MISVKRFLKKYYKKILNYNTPNRWNFCSIKYGKKYLINIALKLLRNSSKKEILIVGERNKYTENIKNIFERKNIKVDVIYFENIKELDKYNKDNISCILCTMHNSKRIFELGKLLVKNEFLRDVPFEYMVIPYIDYTTLLNNDQYSDISFISPLLNHHIDVFDIYNDSLKIFKRKCQIRDFMDLCQLIEYIIVNNIEGEIAEFGSYEGHSGYLIARLLKEMNSLKKFYMFDTFEHFPTEKMGLDYFWSNTHKVNNSIIKQILKEFSNVQLIKGDFTQTFDALQIDKLSLVYVDCDSYRSTKYLINKIYSQILSPGGVMIFEDYGHPPLLGTRVAVHEYFDKMHGCLKFFSQFSGFYIVVKN